MPCAIKNFSYDLTFYASIHLPTCLFSGNVRRYEDWEAEIHAVDLIAYGGEIFDLLRIHLDRVSRPSLVCPIALDTIQ